MIFPSITSTDPQICDLSLCYIYRSVISPSVTSTDLWSFLVLHPQICDISLYYIHRSVIFPCITIKDHMILSCITSTDLWYFLVLQSKIIWSYLVLHPQTCDLFMYFIHRSVIFPCTINDLWSYLVLHHRSMIIILTFLILVLCTDTF